MVHDVSVSLFSFRSGRMPPSALMLAVLLHALVALALWQLAVHGPRLPLPETPIDVTFEQPKPKPTPKPPPPPPAPPAKTAPAPPPTAGLAPPAEITADKPSQAPSKAKQSQQALAPEPPSLQQAVPPPPAPAPPVHLSPLPAPMPAPAPAKPSPPAESLPIRPSPLTRAPQRQQPTIASREEPSPSPFVNPADTYNRARVADNYLWQVVRKLSGYRYQANVRATEGITVVRIDVARNGRLLDVAVVRSSGVPAFDQGVVAGVRAGSPYAPLPPEIHGDSATFTLPLISTRAP